MEPIVEDDPANDRFVIRVDDRLAGYLQYRLTPREIVFEHTEIEDDFVGRGMAGKLVRGALDEVRVRELTVVPRCEFVRSWIDRHPEYLDSVS